VLNVASIICTTADIQGNVVFGKGCVVHPGCAIIAEAGEIIFGDFNIILYWLFLILFIFYWWRLRNSIYFLMNKFHKYL
jgi:hypothetical protein